MKVINDSVTHPQLSTLIHFVTYLILLVTHLIHVFTHLNHPQLFTLTHTLTPFTHPAQNYSNSPCIPSHSPSYPPTSLHTPPHTHSLPPPTASAYNRWRSTFYLVFDFCEHDLAGLLSNYNVKFSLGEIKKVMQQLLEGLFYIHSSKVRVVEKRGPESCFIFAFMSISVLLTIYLHCLSLSNAQCCQILFNTLPPCLPCPPPPLFFFIGEEVA